MNKSEKFSAVRSEILSNGYEITAEDSSRPWGGFFVISEAQSKKFMENYFPGTPAGIGKVSPKFLLVEPGKKLSWQYHHRRSEKWRVLDGPVGVAKSPDDQENPADNYKQGEEITLQQGERHRLVGLSDWGLIAEIWIHSDPTNPSNEDDIVRVQDDFGRSDK